MQLHWQPFALMRILLSLAVFAHLAEAASFLRVSRLEVDVLEAAVAGNDTATADASVFGMFRLERASARMANRTFSNFRVSRGNAIRDDPILEAYPAIQVGDKTIVPTKRMQSLQPRVGRCYVDKPALLPAVRLWREREWQGALKLLAELIQHGHLQYGQAVSRSAMHLAMDIGQMHDQYKVIHDQAQAILKQNPKDLHALFVTALYHACAHQTQRSTLSMFNAMKSETLEASQEWKALNAASPFFAKVLSQIANDVSGAWETKSKPRGVIEVKDAVRKSWPGDLVIGVFGWGPIQGKKGSWQPLPPMKQRIDAALSLAQAFPHAQIIASGGAVTSGKAEGDFIKEDLERQGLRPQKPIIVDAKARDSHGNAGFIGQWMQKHTKNSTLLIVGSDWQNPRFKAIIDATFQVMDVPAMVVPVGAGNHYNAGKDDPALKARIEVEQTAIWRDAARASGYFEDCDFTEPDK